MCRQLKILNKEESCRAKFTRESRKRCVRDRLTPTNTDNIDREGNKYNLSRYQSEPLLSKVFSTAVVSIGNVVHFWVDEMLKGHQPRTQLYINNRW